MQKPELDAADLRILAHLQENARASNNELAEIAFLSPSQCHRRVKRLEGMGVIKGYVTLIDPNAVGMDISIFVSVSLDAHGVNPAQTFIDAIKDVPEVLECYSVTGETDYLLKVCLPDLKAMSEFLMHRLVEMQGVGSVKTSVIVDEIQHSTAIPLPKR
ncbi:MAG: Lrp/AsnC family transcriptional regulator [Rhodospirillales bacterium]|nr:Lrp/AsnC family transcriptional regulator [Rhodospirillales bacterium]